MTDQVKRVENSLVCPFRSYNEYTEYWCNLKKVRCPQLNSEHCPLSHGPVTVEKVSE
jgi:hypothetical protein